MKGYSKHFIEFFFYLKTDADRISLSDSALIWPDRAKNDKISLAQAWKLKDMAGFLPSRSGAKTVTGQIIIHNFIVPVTSLTLSPLFHACISHNLWLN